MRNPRLMLPLFLLLCLSTFFLGGCFTFRYHVTVNRDKTVDTELTVGADKSLVAMGMAFDEEDIFEEIKADLTEEGYRVEDYAENGLVGLRALKSFPSIDEALILESELFSADDRRIRVERGFLSNTYYFDLDLDAGDSVDDDWAMISLVQPEMFFLLTLPVEPQQHNADLVSADGKTLEWNLASGRSMIQVSFREPAAGFYVLTAAAAAALIAATVLLIVNILRKRSLAREDSSPETVKSCPQCGAALRRGTRFCAECGFRLQPGGGAATKTAVNPVSAKKRGPETAKTAYYDGDLFPEEGPEARACSAQLFSMPWVGGTYRGQVRAGQPEGEGKLVLPNGTVYSGSWEKGKPCGQGKTIYQSGAIYDGEFIDGKRHGWGVYTQPDGRRLAGRWDKGEYVG